MALYNPVNKRNVAQVQNAPLRAHMWSAVLEEIRQRNKQKKEWEEEGIRIRKENERYEAFAHLVNNILHCRTSSGRVHAEYPILRRRMKRWESTYGSLSVREWTDITRAFYTHSMDHI